VHGDIKATNVLFDRRGAPYLIDFGVAEATGQTRLPGAGSPVSQSPQQRSGEPADTADDIFALGVLMHELVSGAPPQGAQTAEYSSRGEVVPDALRRLWQAMLAPEPGSRPTAGQVLQHLKSAGFAPGTADLRGKVSATEAAPVALQSIRPQRNPAAARSAPAATARPARGLSPATVGIGLAVLLLAVFGVVFVLPQSLQRESSRTPDEGPAAGAGAREAQPALPEAGDATQASDSAADERPGPGQAGVDEEAAAFSENTGPAGGNSTTRIKAETDDALGDLLSRLERLRYRGIERWGGQEYLDAIDRYAAGDQAYLNKNYKTAGDHYRAATTMLDPFFDRIDAVFSQAMSDARAAFEARDFREAIRLYDLAVTITPGNAQAEKGLARARNLENVLALTERGLSFEKQLELDAARQALENALQLDPLWEPAASALQRVQAALLQLRFEQRMTEGFDALAAGNFDSARVAFEAAKLIRPESRQPTDGLLQVDQEVRLARIRRLETSGTAQTENEQWEAAVETYKDALSVDSDLQFAKDGLRFASERAALHRRLQEFIEDPDALSAPPTMQAATDLLLQLSRLSPAGPRLRDQKEQLSRLLKRAATPLAVVLVSDNQTEVSIFRVGKLGTFQNRELSLRPGSYVATGSRPGYRDVRLEFRVAPEIDLKPITVACEEPI
jgi:tetratricopeptide (TPR) repeat protein